MNADAYATATMIIESNADLFRHPRRRAWALGQEPAELRRYVARERAAEIKRRHALKTNAATMAEQQEAAA